jgi:hypothetical protein
MGAQNIEEIETRHPRQPGSLSKRKPPSLEIVNGSDDPHLMGDFLRVFTQGEKKVIGDIDRDP